MVNRVDAVSPKIPLIIRTDINTWLYQVEANLRRANIINDTTKFYHLIMALDADAFKCVSDIVKAQPFPANAFELAKANLIKEYATTKEEDLKKLLKGQINVTCKPSLILRQIRDLNSSKLSDTVLKTIFLESLPEHHRSILSIISHKDLSTLAEIADKISPNSNYQTFSVSQYSTPNPSIASVDSSSVRRLKSKLDTLINLLKKDQKEKKKGNHEPRSSCKSVSRDRSKSRGREGLCFVHKLYPDNPKSCRQ